MGRIKITDTGFPGLVKLETTSFCDERGYFFESYNTRDYAEAGIVFNPVQDNESCSTKGVIRGLHYQNEPHAQAKLIRVIEGEIFDVALDLRKGSPTFGKWYGLHLDSISKMQFFIPKGFAHGFAVLSEKAIVMYKCDDYYSPKDEGGVNSLDPTLGIKWGIKSGEEIISTKDNILPLFADLKHHFRF
jgi:dTDP-4-dehydrorhamnose 3,5-epimerase